MLLDSLYLYAAVRVLSNLAHQEPPLPGRGVVARGRGLARALGIPVVGIDVFDSRYFPVHWW